MTRHPLLPALAVLAAAALWLALPATALTPLDALRVSSDTTTVLGGAALADEAVAEDDLAGGVTPVATGGLPAEADVVGYHLLPDGDQLLAFDAVVTLPGGLVARPADVVRFDGAAYALAFSGIAAGVPRGAAIDAVSHDGARLLLSFDVTVDLGGLIVDDEDLVAFDGGGFSLVFDGSAAGVPAELDLDAAHRLANGHLLVSFDTAGTIAGIAFDDEDVLEVDPAGPVWELAYDGSAAHAGWGSADLDALAAVAAPVVPGPAGVIRFTSATFVALENDPGGAVAITLERVNGTAGPVGVTLTTADGTAAEALDYLGLPGGGTVFWGDGEGGVKTVLVTLLDDDLLEGNETVLLALSAPTGGAVLGDPSAAVLTLVDDEAAGPALVDVPALGSLGLTLLALLLAAVGAVLVRRG